MNCLEDSCKWTYKPHISLSLLLHRAFCRFTNHHTTNKWRHILLPLSLWRHTLLPLSLWRHTLLPLSLWFVSVNAVSVPKSGFASGVVYRPILFVAEKMAPAWYLVPAHCHIPLAIVVQQCFIHMDVIQRMDSGYIWTSPTRMK